MEQAATAGLTTLFAQLGVGGLVIAILVGCAVWWLKASKDLRTEKRGVIEQLETKLAVRDTQIEELKAERDQLRRDLLNCQFPDREQVMRDDS